MVWAQIALFSLASGFCLLSINRLEVPKTRWVWRMVFLITVSITASCLVGIQQAPGDDVSSRIENIKSLIPLFVVFGAEAVLISIIIEKHISKGNIYKFIAVYFISLFLTVFMTTLVLVSIWPGS